MSTKLVSMLVENVHLVYCFRHKNRTIINGPKLKFGEKKVSLVFSLNTWWVKWGKVIGILENNDGQIGFQAWLKRIYHARASLWHQDFVLQYELEVGAREKFLTDVRLFPSVDGGACWVNSTEIVPFRWAIGDLKVLFWINIYQRLGWPAYWFNHCCIFVGYLRAWCRFGLIF